MKLLKGKVNWMEGYANEPIIQILVDKMPDLKDLRYQEKEGIYYAEYDGYVSFYYYVRPDDGFGGRHFHITMENGDKKVLKGPWSSNAGSVNRVGFGPCVDVSIIDDYISYDRGHTFYSGHVTHKFIEENKHLIKIGSGYKRWGKEDEGFVEFPKGSGVIMMENERFGWYTPCVLMPNGDVWSKNNLKSKYKSNCVDLSAEQTNII